MDEADSGAPAAPDAPRPDALDALIDRWFGDHAIPNHFAAAREDLKKRLREQR